MIKLYTNENFPFQSVQVLRELGSDFNALANRIHLTISDKKDLSKKLIRINRPIK